jgi:hypothetical protein
MRLGRDVLGAHSVCQILGGENSTQTLLIVYDENAVGPLGCAELTSFCNGDSIWNGKGRAGFECRYGAFGNVGFESTSAATLMGGRYGSLARELMFYPFAQSLLLEISLKHESEMHIRSEKMASESFVSPAHVALHTREANDT